MRKKFVKLISILMVMTVVSGCGKEAPGQSGGLVQEQGSGGMAGDGTFVSGEETGGPGAAGTGAEGAAGSSGGTGAEGVAGSSGGNGATGGAATGGDPGTSGTSGKQSLTTGEPKIDFVEDIYTEEENILPITESASAWGISYKIENVEYTDQFGDRNSEHLQIFASEASADSQGTLSEGFKYLFLTITFTNTTDQAQEIVRTANGIAVIGASLNTISWATDTCYYDTDWEKGMESQKHHWVLEPGESVTSEVGWVIEACASVVGAEDTLAARMGSAGPYELYYHVKQYDGDNEGSYFIDLGVKVE